nr:MAG TPA: hypothetical protein [Caudoviricetes sp.]
MRAFSARSLKYWHRRFSFACAAISSGRMPIRPYLHVPLKLKPFKI